MSSVLLFMCFVCFALFGRSHLLGRLRRSDGEDPRPFRLPFEGFPSGYPRKTQEQAAEGATASILLGPPLPTPFSLPKRHIEHFRVEGDLFVNYFPPGPILVEVALGPL